MAKRKGMNSAKMKRLAKAGKGPHSKAARVKAQKTRAKNAEAAREFNSVQALSTGQGSTHHAGEPTGGVDIPLHAIPDMRSRAKVPARKAVTGTALMITPDGDVQLVIGKVRITIERSK